MFKCDLCEFEIEPGMFILKGFDCTFCSTYCREQIIELNKTRDPILSNYNLWYKAKPDKIIVEPTLKRTQSIIDIKGEDNKSNNNILLEQLNILLKQCGPLAIGLTMVATTTIIMY